MSVSELGNEAFGVVPGSSAPRAGLAAAPDFDFDPDDDLIALTGDGRIAAIGARVAAMLGYDPADLMARDGIDLVHPYDRKIAVGAIARRLELPDAPPMPLAIRLRNARGGYWVLELTHRADADHSSFPGVVFEVSDAANRWDNEAALREARVLQAVVATIAARFIDSPTEEVAAAIADALALVGRAANVDRASVYLLEDATHFVLADEWCAPGVEGIGTDRFDADDFPGWFAALQRLQPLAAADFTDLPERWAAEREFLVDSGIRSLLQVPLTTAGTLVGIITFESSVVARTWDDDTTMVLRTVADIIAAALARATAELEREQTQTWYGTLVEHSSDGLVVISPEGRLQYASPVAEKLFGFRTEDMVDHDMLDLVHPDDLDGAIEWLASAATVDGRHQPSHVRIGTSDGRYLPCEFEANSLINDPAVGGIVLNVRDITDRLAAEAALREREARLSALIENITGAVSRCEPTAPWRTVFVSDAISDITGISPEEFVAEQVDFEDLIHPEDRVGRSRAMREAVETGSSFTIEYQLRHRDGSTRWVIENGQPSFDDLGEPQYIDAAIFDITERKQLEERLTFEAGHDPLTRLLNRQSLLHTLETSLAAASDEENVAVLFMDLDRFKLVNDALGHVAGDELLIAFSRRLRGVLRTADIAARPGGDEFVVLCRDIRETADAVHVAERIQTALVAPFRIQGQEVFARASIGIAIAERTMDAETLLRYADMAAYRAKERGRNRFELFDEVLRQATAARLEIESNLHRAVEYGELELYYQPVVELRTGLLLGFEALVRWNHPERGRLMPGEFLGAAEASGLIVPIGTHLLELACQQLKRWEGLLPGGSTPTLAVNLSARQLAQPDLAEQVGSIIAAAGVDPALLCLEITESVLMEEAAYNIEMLHRLKALGVELAIDDFGTGYSSLSYLRRFPVDVLKVDQSFVAELGNDDGGTTIVMAIAGLGHALGLELLAEGVEEPFQADLLARLGIDHAQGFLYSKPVAVPEATALLKRGYASPPE